MCTSLQSSGTPLVKAQQTFVVSSHFSSQLIMSNFSSIQIAFCCSLTVVEIGGVSLHFSPFNKKRKTLNKSTWWHHRASIWNIQWAHDAVTLCTLSHSLVLCSEFCTLLAESQCVASVKPKKREHKLRCDANWQGVLKKKKMRKTNGHRTRATNMWIQILNILNNPSWWETSGKWKYLYTQDNLDELSEISKKTYEMT